MTEQRKTPAKRKTQPKKAKPVEVPVEESKSEKEPKVILEVSESNELGGQDAQSKKDSGNGTDNAPAETPPRSKRVGTTLWTS